MENIKENAELLSSKQMGGTRNYGIDLLRILSMFMVVVLHVLGKGGVLNNVQNFTLKGEIFWGIEIACFCAVNCYALISGYVGINAKHKYTNLISLCLQVVFYSVLITVVEIFIAYSNGTQLSLQTLFFHLIPSMREYWYFSAYFCLFFFMPMLNYIVHNIQREILKTLSIFILIIFCGWNILSDIMSGVNYGYSFLWLAILYVLGGYFAKYKTLENLSISKSFVGYFICVAATIIIKIFIAILPESVSSVFVWPAYNSLPVILMAVFLLSAFSKMKLSEGFSKVISFVSPLAFGVYLIHCHPYIYELLGNLFAWIAKEPIYLGVICVLGISLGIFVVCLLLDWIRSLLFKLFKMKEFASWIEKIVSALIGWICKLLHISLDEKIDEK